MACSDIFKGQRIRPNERDDWEPLIPPVLHENHRSSRCAFCFKKFTEKPILIHADKQSPKYRLLLCSPTCRDGGIINSFDREQEAIWKLCENGGGPPKIFSTAILLYRIVRTIQKDPDIKTIVDFHQGRPVDELSEEDDNLHHTRAVIATVVGMLQSSPSANDDIFLPPLDELANLVSKIKINGFSICDGESVALGVGFYSLSRAINHSCKPNMIQTFLYGQQQPPTLIITACENVSEHQELCLSYIESSCPRSKRRQILQAEYRFWCDCALCQDDDRESKVIGLICSNCSSAVPVKYAEHLEEARCIYKCSECGFDDFKLQLQKLNEFPFVPPHSPTILELEETYQYFRSICFPYSWFVQESGERLVQGLLEVLGKASYQPGEEERSASLVMQDRDARREGVATEAAMRALQVIDELRHHATGESSAVDSIKRSLLTYKAAKLRLFLFPDPRQAIEELNMGLKTLRLYYPQNHELILGLHETLSMI